MSNKIVWLIIGLFAILAVFGIVYFFFANRETDLTATISPTPTTFLGNDLNDELTTPTVALNPGWHTYRSTSMNFSVNYPEDVQVTTPDINSLVLNKLGPSQVQGTELFDGFSIAVSSGSFSPTNFESFKGFVEAERQKKVDDPATESVGDLKDVAVAGKQGFQFEQRALGDFTLIYLPVKSNDYFLITKTVADPGNLGFEETVSAILSTLSF